LSSPDGEVTTLKTFTEGAEKTAAWNVVSLSEVLDSARLDAEYYHPTLVSIESRVRACEYRLLGDIAGYINRGTQPTYDEDGMIPALRTVNIREKGLTDTRREFVTQDFYESKPRGRVAEDDILITSTGVGTLVLFHVTSLDFLVDIRVRYRHYDYQNSFYNR
jgi:hypothetical protein